MKPKSTAAFLIALFLSFGISRGQPAPKELSLEECIILALKNNLNLAIEVLNPELADAALSQAREKFLPSLTMEYGTQENNSASYSWIDAAEKVRTFFDNYSLQLQQLIPSGATLAVSFYSYNNDTTRKFQMINPRYGSTLSFQITQPLLKDFGFKVTKKAILVARNNRSISENTLKSTLLATIFAVEEAYWNLVYSIENLKVKQQSLELAQQLWLKNKKEMEVGTLAPVEILSAQAEVATREADILQAEAEVRNAQDSLRTILNIQSQEKSGLEQIAPKDQPIFEKREINLEETIQATLASRPELESSRLEIANSEFELSYARNQLLPGLNFRASYWSPGISGSQLLYKDNDPLTEIVIGVIPGGARNAIKDALNLKYRNWELSLSLNLPLNTFFSRAAYVQARLNSDQARLKLKNQEQQILLEVGNASRAVETDYQRVVAYRVARELAEKKLEAEEKKMKVGLTTNYQILQFQRDLANARSAELRAIIDYNLSLARLDKVTGTSLERTEVR